jgi:hypothetical protein
MIVTDPITFPAALSARPDTEPQQAARFMNTYARGYHAGAFATPTAAECAELIRTGFLLSGPGWVAAAKHLTKDSVRKDFTGRRYTLPAGSNIITHLAADPDAVLPDLGAFAVVYAYREDPNVTAQLQAQGREPRAVRVSAASEIITAWGRPDTGTVYPEWDTATVRQVGLSVSDELRQRIRGEATRLQGWLDDFPFYSDGSWAALNLRGFKPDDPTWGIKPAEMSKSWWAEHPEAKALTRCDWTVLAEQCPATRALVESVEWWGGLERVRFLRMAGRGGKGGKLLRHTDVTDRAAGTQDGQIVRFHIPIVTHPAITMSAWNLDGRGVGTHLEEWGCYYLDARKPHAVTNPTGVDRIHLVVDVLCDAAVRSHIIGGYEHVR